MEDLFRLKSSIAMARQTAAERKVEQTEMRNKDLAFRIREGLTQSPDSQYNLVGLLQNGETFLIDPGAVINEEAHTLTLEDGRIIPFSEFHENTRMAVGLFDQHAGVATAEEIERKVLEDEKRFQAAREHVPITYLSSQLARRRLMETFDSIGQSAGDVNAVRIEFVNAENEQRFRYVYPDRVDVSVDVDNHILHIGDEQLSLEHVRDIVPAFQERDDHTWERVEEVEPRGHDIRRRTRDVFSQFTRRQQAAEDVRIVVTYRDGGREVLGIDAQYTPRAHHIDAGEGMSVMLRALYPDSRIAIQVLLAEDIDTLPSTEEMVDAALQRRIHEELSGPKGLDIRTVDMMLQRLLHDPREDGTICFTLRDEDDASGQYTFEIEQPALLYVDREHNLIQYGNRQILPEEVLNISFKEE